MSYQQGYQFDYMADGGDMSDFVKDVEEENQGGDMGLDEYDMLTKVSDTSSAQARKGKDIQGIPWDRLKITREKYRLTRLEQYRNYENIPLSGEAVDKECKQMQQGGNYYDLFHNTRLVKPTILYFQVWNLSEVLNFAGHVAPTESLDKQGKRFFRGGMHFMASNNDCGIREYDMEKFQLLNHFRFPWPVNHTSISPDCRLVAVVGDHVDALLMDSQNGKDLFSDHDTLTIAKVVGHLDYSFASAWHPDGRIFATGNQDKTSRVWDIRNLSLPVAVLKNNFGAARSIRFSSDGQFMVVVEPAYFVHIYSTKADYKGRQEIDFFGEISGASMSPDDESLYIGIWDRTYASLLQYNRRHTYGYLDSYF
ncbi:general transcriptional corepressor tupA-like [Pyrus x bretschneideri]|uniref:general transcriptional corepressor tupA-like n=1 Tax=Pyrus x bretschneideri TaxID=225117 RepID=UPI00202F6026|nr:general transcriptional corepressor tupA-like [Pyrus x bretschneideri]